LEGEAAAEAVEVAEAAEAVEAAAEAVAEVVWFVGCRRSAKDR
jgi:hypothetical protein